VNQPTDSDMNITEFSVVEGHSFALQLLHILRWNVTVISRRRRRFGLQDFISFMLYSVFFYSLIWLFTCR